jgi:hypothetical protein
LYAFRRLRLGAIATPQTMKKNTAAMKGISPRRIFDRLKPDGY